METLSSMGFEVYEVFSIRFGSWSPIFSGLKKWRDKAGSSLSIHLLLLSSPFLFFSDYIRRFEDGLSAYRCFFEAAVTLGAKFLCFMGKGIMHTAPLRRKIILNGMQRYIRLGMTYGVTVAQENVNRFRSERPSFIKRMRRYLSEECAFVLDVKQAVRAGEDPYEMLTAMGERLVHVHINDNLPRRDCMLPGEGQMITAGCGNCWSVIRIAAILFWEVYRRDFNALSEINQGTAGFRSASFEALTGFFLVCSEILCYNNKKKGRRKP